MNLETKINSSVIGADSCRKFIKKVLEKLGAPTSIATRWAELLVETSLLGFDSHGIRMLERYVKHINSGGIKISAKPKITSQQHACISMDARGGLGHIAADRATSIAIKKAKKFGLSCVTVKNGNHVGACGLYARKAASEDYIGICTTVSRPTMAPWGGKTALLGSNPIAICAPVKDKPNFLFDTASTVVAMGKITAAYDRNKRIPDTWALDKNGWPTTDPAAAITGTLFPIGGHKGYGLAMGFEILSSLLSGGMFSSQVESWIQQTKKSTGASFTVIVLDISAFQDVALFKRRMKLWVELLTTSSKRPGFDRIYYPGEIEAEKHSYRLKHGISVSVQEIDMFDRLAARFNIKKPR